MVKDKNSLTPNEYNALLLIHTENIDSTSFATEIQFHADTALAPVREHAIVADMFVGESTNAGKNIPSYHLKEDGYKSNEGEYYLEQEEAHKG